jgi:hypothetical protein
MNKIFISYRRDDSGDSTGRIFDRLKAYYGIDRLIRDVDSIPPGSDFRKYLAGEVNRCQVLIAVIGKQWQDIKDAAGKPRLEDPNDLVRIEIETALQRNIPIIPVIVGGASFPEAKKLPAAIRGVVDRNGVFVRPDPDFHHDCDRLIASLDNLLKGADKEHAKPSRRNLWVALAAVGVLAILLIVGAMGLVAFILHGRGGQTAPPAAKSSPPSEATPVLRLKRNSRIELKDTVGLLDVNGEFTVEFSVKLPKVDGDEKIRLVGDWNETPFGGWMFVIDQNNENRPSAVMRTQFARQKGDVMHQRGPGVVPLSFNTWHHIAYVKRRDNQFAIFVDGRKWIWFDWIRDVPFKPSGHNLSIGWSPHSPELPAGFELRFFRASSKALYEDSFLAPDTLTREASTVILLDFPGTGSKLPDQVGGHDGLITDADWVSR